LLGEERQHRMRDVALNKRRDQHCKKHRPVLGGDVDEVPQPRHVAILRRHRHRSGQLCAEKVHRRRVRDCPPSLANANDLAVRPSGVDVDRPLVVGNTQVQAFGRLRGRQPLEDQRGVGECLASGGGAGVSEVAGGEVGA
jgi:hypothetical protein